MKQITHTLNEHPFRFLFREFVEDKNGYFDDNESGAFKSAFISTGVNTTTLYIEKAPLKAFQELQEFITL